MAPKVSFDPVAKVITVTEAPDVDGNVNLDVKVDLYSDGKEEWLATPELNKYQFFMRAVGGDDLPGEKSLGSTFFLQHGWVIRPYEASHNLLVNGNLYTEDGTSPYIPVIGTYTVMVISAVSSLVDSTVQQLPEIEYASYGGHVTIDVDGPDSIPGTVFPAGTPESPSDNLADTLLIAAQRGFGDIHVVGELTMTAAIDIGGYRFTGDSSLSSQVIIDSAPCHKCEFERMEISGTLGSGSVVVVRICEVGDIDSFSGNVSGSVLSACVCLSDAAHTHFFDCYDGTPGETTPFIDVGDSPGGGVWGYNGGLTYKNLSDPTTEISVNISAGTIILDSTVTDGQFTIRGVGTLTDNSAATVNSVGLLSQESISDATWDEDLSTHSPANSAAAMQKRILGLGHEFFFMDNTVYDGDGQLTDCRVRLYLDEADTLAATDGGEPVSRGGTDPEHFAEYTGASVWTGATMDTFRQTRVDP